MIVLAVCFIGTLLAYWLGVTAPGPRNYGTPRGWLLAGAIGLVLGLAHFVFSLYGLLFSLESFDSLF